LRAPNVALAMPPADAAMTDVARKPVVGQDMYSRPPMSFTALGMTVDISSAFIECNSMPVDSTASGTRRLAVKRSIHRGVASVSGITVPIRKVCTLLKDAGKQKSGSR
jgi:hypothetical protein